MEADYQQSGHHRGETLHDDQPAERALINNLDDTVIIELTMFAALSNAHIVDQTSAAAIAGGRGER